MAEAVSSELVRITPEMAAEWLSRNERNRTLRERKARTYADAIIAGDWQVTGDSIKFDHTGRLIDGQHRLYAIVLAETPATMLIVSGLNPEAQFVVDTGMKRTAGDAVKFAGFTNASQLAALARQAILWEGGNYRYAQQGVPNREVTSTEVVNWISSNESEAKDAISCSRPLAKSLNIPASVAALIVLVLQGVDHDACGQFVALIEQMKTQGDGDPISALLRRYRSMQDNRERGITPSVHIFLVFRTWNAWRAGMELRQLKISNQVGRDGKPKRVEIPKPH